MYGTDVKYGEITLLEEVQKVYLDEKDNLLEILKKGNENVKIHIYENVPHSYIKEAREYKNIESSFIGTKTDKGGIKQSRPDGGIICVQVPTENGNIILPLAWFELKSSWSSTKHGTKGQASGLIAEQDSRCRAWVEPMGQPFKPLVAFMIGSDYNTDNGTYNIDRITLNLATIGNKNPYEENTSGVSWLFYKEKYTPKEYRQCIKNVLYENAYHMRDILLSF